MFGRFSLCALAGAAFAGFALGVSASSGYLPAVGPVALRYRPLPQIVTNMPKMALPMPAAPAPVAVAPTNFPAAAAPTNLPVAAPVAPQTSAAPAMPLPEPDANFPASAPKYSAQMLMKYFNHSTNGTGSGVIAPVDFAMPPANTTPPSTGTYSTNPK
jgi:hypothetical protein